MIFLAHCQKFSVVSLMALGLPMQRWLFFLLVPFAKIAVLLNDACDGAFFLWPAHFLSLQAHLASQVRVCFQLCNLLRLPHPHFQESARPCSLVRLCFVLLCAFQQCWKFLEIQADTTESHLFSFVLLPALETSAPVLAPALFPKVCQWHHLLAR